MNEKEVMDYYEVLLSYYEAIGNRGKKGKLNEKKGMKCLTKLDEWEEHFEELLKGA
jgi:hypothetical protein